MIKAQLELLAQFDKTAARIKDICQSRTVVYVTNPGNWGDALIREGTERFLRSYGIAYVKVRHTDLKKRRVKLDRIIAATNEKHPVMLYNGCGIYVPEYDAIDEIASLSHSFSKSILLPSTYGIDMQKRGFSSDTIFFARDRFQSLENAPGAHFCHDLAFFVQAPVFPDGKGVGNLMRTDREARVGVPIPRLNQDISQKGRTHHDVKGFFRRIAQFEEINTNRLHVGIAALLLGRKVNLYEGNYFKINAIYKSSIKDRFQDVNFITL